MFLPSNCFGRCSVILFPEICYLCDTNVVYIMMMRNSVNTSFTDREYEIAGLLSRGMSEKEIAEKLHISPATVNNHTRNIRAKFGLSKNSEIILAYIAERNKKPFSIRNIREYGINIILVLINICSFNRGF